MNAGDMGDDPPVVAPGRTRKAQETPFTDRKVGWRGVAWAGCAALVLGLLAADLVGNLYGTMPDAYSGAYRYVSADSLVFPSLASELSSGASTHEDWISNPAPYWLTVYPIVRAAMGFTGNDWQLSLAMYCVASALAVVLALCVVMMRSSAAPAATCLLASAVAVSLFALVSSHAGGGSGAFMAGERMFNVATFFLVTAGMARVCAERMPFANPLACVYLVLCFAFGLSDSLFFFHVALPVFFVSLYRRWRHRVFGGATPVCVLALAGCVLVVVGYRVEPALSPMIQNPFVGYLNTNLYRLANSYAHLAESGQLSQFHHPIVLWLGKVAGDLKSAMAEFSVQNLLMAACALAFFRRALGYGNDGNKVEEKDAFRDASLTVLAQMVVGLWCSLLVLAFFINLDYRYLRIGFWVPALSLSVLWAANQGRGGFARHAGTCAATIAVAWLTLSLMFHRVDERISAMAVCSEQILDGEGLGRGMLPYWHATLVAMVNGRHAHDLVYYSNPKHPYFHAYRHVGHVSRLRGTAGYVVVRNDSESMQVARSKDIFGLPARIASCGGESYLLYADGHVGF